MDSRLKQASAIALLIVSFITVYFVFKGVVK